MFFNDPSVLLSTPVDKGREDEYLEQLSYAFTYSADIVTILRPGGFQPKIGFTLDGDTADTDFAALLAALRHVLFVSAVSFSEFSKLLDLEHDYDFYHVVLTEILFTVLPVLLRGSPSSGGAGGGRQKTPTFNAVSVDRKPGSSIECVGRPRTGRLCAGRVGNGIRCTSDHPPPLDRAPPGSDGGVSEPPPKQHPADMALHPASVDFTYTPEPVALHPFIVDTEEWPVPFNTVDSTDNRRFS
ncbi:hypothetical protein CYMTET_47432 [Cymbomonas tetramitiformis]|uniref:Uncharacterized protein n=1 Tax=Cymbomonas tetramitiformis TaxID=36881 RepID=A0AAE0BU84_9CHLO|nr:hypothetical protein CYMTET_47432 [Cymbomonas tetramitiformis]